MSKKSTHRSHGNKSPQAGRAVKLDVVQESCVAACVLSVLLAIDGAWGAATDGVALNIDFGVQGCIAFFVAFVATAGWLLNKGIPRGYSASLRKKHA